MRRIALFALISLTVPGCYLEQTIASPCKRVEDIRYQKIILSPKDTIYVFRCEGPAHPKTTFNDSL